jgi:hypothetical protein
MPIPDSEAQEAKSLGGSHMSLNQEIDKAIGAHGMWKQRLRGAIHSGTSEFSVDTVAKDDACEFGKWLNGSSLSAADKAAAECQAVKGLHAKFHQCASNVLKCAVSGKRADAEALMGNTGEFAAISSDLTRAMLTWKTKIAK